MQRPSGNSSSTSAGLLFVTGAVLLVLQTTLLHLLPDWFGRPNLLFLLVVFIGINLDVYRGSILVLLFGLLMDVFSGIFLGIHPLVFLLVFFILRAASRKLAINETVHQIPLVALSYLSTLGIIFLCTSFFASDSRISWSWHKEILQILILGVSTIPFFHFFAWITDGDRPLIPRNPLRRPKNTNRFIRL